MNRLRRTVLSGATAAAVAAALAPYAPALAGALIGQDAPALSVETLDGQRFELTALRGRVVLVNFWATWCPPCRDEMPLLDVFYREHRAAGLELIGLSTDRRRDIDAVRRVMQPFAYPAALLAAASRNGFGAPAALPMTWVVDAQGIVRRRLVAAGGPLAPADLAAAVLPLLPGGSSRT